MAAQYHSLFTEKGLELLRESIQNGTKLGITHMSFGDGNGELPIPDAKFTKMENEVYRVALNRLAPSKENQNWLEADGVIPSAIGGFNIREVGLWAGNVMVAYANYPPTYKPSGDQGTAQIKTIRIILQIDNTANFELKIDASVVMATIAQLNDVKQNILEETTGAVKNFDALKTIQCWNGRIVNLSSVVDGKGLGGGKFICIQSNLFTEKFGLIVRSRNIGFEDYYFVRINYDYVTPEMFGALGDGVNDDYEALQACISHELKTELAARTYCTSKPLYYESGKVIHGTGYQKTVIKKTTSSSDTKLPDITVGSKKASQQVDAVLIARAYDGGYNHYSDLSGFLLTRSDTLGSIGYGLYAPFLAEACFKNIRTSKSDLGIYSLDSWMVNWTRVTSSANCGWTILAGTSNTFLSCWSTDTAENNYAYRFENLYYSASIGCGADHIGSDGKPAKAIYRIVNSNLSIKNCACENVHAYKFLYLKGADIEVDSYVMIQFNNKYKTIAPTWGDEDALIDARSQTRLRITNCRLDLLNKDLSVSPKFIDITDTSTLFYKDNNPSIKVTGVSHNDTTSFGIKYSSATSVYVDLGNYIYESASASKFYAGSTVKNLDEYNTEKVFMFNKGFTALPYALDNENLNSLRYLGSLFLTQSFGSKSTITNGYPTDGGGWNILQISSKSNEANNVNNNSFQLANQFDSNKLYFRNATYGSSYTNWNKIYHSANTTVTADGTLKSASPIIKLYSDRIEFNEGAAEQNPEFEKVDIGYYLVKNTLGFAKEGWWIDVPTDSNGNKICAIKYKELENGDIEIKTFKRKFDFETASIVADEDQPIDIPKNMNDEQRWIDIRLHQIISDEQVEV